MDSAASIIITAALVFYSIGVWSERISGRLKPWHLIFFVLGLVCDTWGTGMMFHALWAFFVLRGKDEHAIENFHKFSVAVWAIWLIPYLSPVFFDMAG